MIRFLLPLALLASVVLPAEILRAQNAITNPSQTSTATPPSEPVYREYRKVTIGMTTAEARENLGKARSRGPKQDFYVFSKKESAQVYYRDGKVFAVSTDYIGEDSGAPAPAEVLGEGVEILHRKNGSMYKVVRYPQAGFWVSYSQTAGKSPITTVTMQKIRATKRSM